MHILGIETSCDETAASVVATTGDPNKPWAVRSNVIASQVEIHREWGGVVPEIASRQHVRDICGVVDRALADAGTSWSGIDAIAVTQGPGLVGSLLVGVAFAKASAAALGIPIVAVHHLAGHIESIVLDHGPIPLPAIVLVVSFLLAILLGAAHALEPGHGKTLVAAYLVGSHGTVAQAVLLGLVVTFTHTFSVLLLGVLVLFLSAHFVPATLFPWLGFGSGVLIALVGLSLLRSRWREWRAIRAPAHAHDHAHDHTHGHPHEHTHDHTHDHGHGHDHAHSHGPDHHHDHDTHTHAPADAAHGHSHRHGPEHSGHSHVPPGQPTLRGILALGVSGGLVPCPAGIVVLLAAVASGRIGFGLLLILAFSVGLAAVLVGVGVLCVTARRFFDRIPASGAFARRLGVASAVFVTLFGIGLAVRSLGAPLG